MARRVLIAQKKIIQRKEKFKLGKFNCRFWVGETEETRAGPSDGEKKAETKTRGRKIRTKRKSRAIQRRKRELARRGSMPQGKKKSTASLPEGEKKTEIHREPHTRIFPTPNRVQKNVTPLKYGGIKKKKLRRKKGRRALNPKKSAIVGVRNAPQQKEQQNK